MTKDRPTIEMSPAEKKRLGYELDDGPLTEAQLEAICTASPASQIPEAQFTERLF